jgi:uncharacterized SAM-binding protein YcdF (DUF218 family)
MGSAIERGERQDVPVGRVDRDDAVGAAEERAAGRRLFGRAIWLVLAAAGLVLALLILDFARFVSTLEASEPRLDASADGIVALTGGAERISDAVELLSQGRAKRLLITGVNQATSDVAISSASPSGADLLACCIEIDRNALNTVGNALEAARWVNENHFRRIIVVTSSYHMPRSLLELRRVLPDTDLIAYPVVSHQLRLDHWWEDPATLRVLVVEYVKYTGALIGLRIEPPTADAPRSAGL